MPISSRFFACSFVCASLASLTLFTPLASYSPLSREAPSPTFCDYGLCEFLYWTYHHSGYDFAVETEGWKRSPIAFLKEPPKGKRHSVSSHYSPGLRITQGASFFRCPIFLEAELTYVPFRDHDIVKGPHLASLTLPTTIAGGFPADCIRSSRSLTYLLSDLLVRFNQSFSCGVEWGAYTGVRCMALIQKWTLSHAHTFNKGPSKVNWDLKMGNVGGTLGLRAGYQYSDRLACSAHVGGSLLKGVRGGSHLSWNLNTKLPHNDHIALHTLARRWIVGWDASLQAEVAWFKCFPCTRFTFGYEIQQWFRIPQRDHYDFVSWNCYKKYSTLTFYGANVGVLFYY